MMKVETETIDGVVVVTSSGSIDVVTRGRLKDVACLKSLCHDVVFNLAEVDFIDSSGLSSLVEVIRRFRDCPKSLVLAAPPAHVLDVLEMTLVDQIVPILKSVEEALKKIQKSESTHTG